MKRERESRDDSLSETLRSNGLTQYHSKLREFAPKQDFYTKATKYQRGDVDPANGFEFKADCYNLPISELSDVKQSVSV